MCCTGGGCPSYQCSGGGNPVVRNGRWTCCTPVSTGGEFCDSSLIYSERGTCRRCDAPPGSGGGGGRRPCSGRPTAPRLRSPGRGTVYENHGAKLLQWWRPSQFGSNACARSRRYNGTLWYPQGLGSYSWSQTPGEGESHWINTRGFDGRFQWRITACTYGPPGEGTGCARSATWDFYVNPSSASCTQVTGVTSLPDGGSTSLPISEASGYFNLYATDSDNLEYTTRWGSSCSLIRPTIDRVEITARGNENNGWPTMDVIVGDDIGVRNTECTFNVDTSSYSTYSCSLNDDISTLEISYPNDDGSRSLEVDYIEYFYTDGSSRVIESESNSDSGDKVIYDRVGGGTAFDGNDTSNGQELMDDEGALRFPIPLMFDPASPPATCPAQATVSDDTGVGNTCSLNVDVCGWPPSEGPTNPNPPSGTENVVLPPTVSWDAPSDWGEACGGSRGFDVYGAVRVGGTCPDPGAAYTALPTCANLPEGTTSCADPFFNIRDTEFCWYAEANNGSYSIASATTGAEVWWFKTEDPILYQNWVTTIFGDFYTGSLISEFPDPTDYVAPWTPPSLSFERNPADSDTTDVATLSSNGIDITSSDTTQGYSPASQSNFSVEFASFDETWPPNFTGRPPADAINLPLSGSCDDIFITSGDQLDTVQAYEGDVNCIEDAINNTSTSANGYQLANDGVAVVYVTGSGDLRITDEFLTDNDDYRVVLVTGPDVDVKIDRGLSLAALPDWTSTPLIEAAFVVVGTMEYEGVALLPIGDIVADPDDSIMVEGPVVGRNIQFNRNLGPLNSYPAEIIQYNNKFIYDLTQQERQSASGGNYSGLFVIDVDWIETE